MRIENSSNPVLGKTFFSEALVGTSTGIMTINGTINKTLIMLLLVGLTFTITWKMAFAQNAGVIGWSIAGAIGGLIVALVITFKKEWSTYLAPIYALLEGLFLGAVSAVVEMQIPGIVFKAVGLTFGVLFLILFLYRSGIIKATEKFKMGVVAATGAIALFYLVAMVLSLFGIRIGFLHEGGVLGILFSLAVVVIAALNLILDFDFIEQGAAEGLPKYMEWYGSFALMVTLIWLYLEILRLLAKILGSSRE